MFSRMKGLMFLDEIKEMGFDNVVNANGGFDSLKKVGLPVIAKEKK